MRKHDYRQAKIYSDIRPKLKQILKDDDLVKQLLGKTKILKFKKNTNLNPDKSEQDSIYILYTGMIHVCTVLEGTQPKNLTDCLFFKIGDLIRLDYSLDNTPPLTKKTYQAIRDSILLRISIQDWNELSKKYTQLISYYRLTIINEHMWHKQLRNMRFLNVMDRYYWLENHYPELCSLERRHLLSLLDISLSSYKNIKKELKKQRQVPPA